MTVIYNLQVYKLIISDNDRIIYHITENSKTFKVLDELLSSGSKLFDFC